jgi:hypothetical protein
MRIVAVGLALLLAGCASSYTPSMSIGGQVASGDPMYTGTTWDQPFYQGGVFEPRQPQMDRSGTPYP